MKVTVCFGRTGIVVPCKEGQLRVRELTQQALQRYLKTREKDPGYWVKIHHLEYTDGGILDPDDVLADVVEDKDKLIAVFDEQEPLHKIESPSGNPAGRQSPDAFETEVAAQLAAFKPVGGEIEVTPSALKLGTPLLVRRSSDPAPSPPADAQPSASHPSGQSLKPVIPNSTQDLEDGEVMNGVQTELTSPKTMDALSNMTRTVEISGKGGPLGIHVVPFFSSLSGRILGLFIRGIEENSRSKQEGLFHENECIVKINSVDLVDKTFAQAQDVFRQAMKSPSVLLHVLPPQNREQYEKSVIGPLNIFGNNDGVLRTKVPPPVHGKSGIKTVNLTGTSSPEEDASTSLQQSKSPRVPRLGRKPSSPSLSPLMGFGSKKNAKKIKIDLKKGPEGLGFTVVTRDSSIHGPGPIFVKNILPKGAAIKDGRLQSGDRILEVNGRDVTGRTQEELVAMLRSTKQGETASLVIARQEGTFLPRELKGEPDCYALSLETTEQLTFEIPLNDSGSAGLGVSLKGNKSRETGTDLGIFIKSIIHGGAAFKDGRLQVNDQLIAVNGESLLGKSNHEAMETLRRSMSMEGNIRGMIQLVILRRPGRPLEEPAECGAFSKACFENCQNAVTTSRRNDNSTLHPFGTYSPQNKQKELLLPNDGWAESGGPPPPPPHPVLELGLEDYSHSSGVDSAVFFPDQRLNFRSVTPARQPESMNLKASKSMDLVPDESKVHSLAGHKSDSPSKDFGPTLGLKKSSSLESLQTAVAEVRKNELPFHRPRPHVVRGRGCNESFRAAIDKSYDGPEELEADGLSDKSSHSGQGALNYESAPQGNSELENAENKARKVKKPKEKEKKKEKGKFKVKEKKQKEGNEDPERKIKRKGFGAMLRFGKKKDDKGGKAEQKGPLKHGGLREEELEKMKEERERIGAKHQELREKQARGLIDYAAGAIGSLHDMDDDEMDPNYARVNHFREPCASANVYRSPSPPRAGPLGYPRDGRPLSPERDHLEGLYAKVNKPYHPPVPVDSGRSMSGSTDRIQKLRKEYYQARREAFALYEDSEGRARPDYDLHWVSGKGPDGNAHNLRFEGMERQYASLPRGGPADPVDYLTAAPRGLYKERELPYYPGAHPVHPPKGSYPRPPDLRITDLRYPQYYPPPPAPQHKGPFRQDVPPSPPQHHRVPAYPEMGRPLPRGGSPDQYPYRMQDPRQKNPMTAAV
ncbi:partitioning defective 3 homolog B isoform X5 [Physeter macrocephalus]|uniref:Partitioning defective 3 homolog B n=1 Tax=Physeter macrocephalus TaxID=9755 RepID=A0A2Y9SNN0_PHYMC|nr:partitioning defective 3 homolog B isoform X5 [Physeter catodon]|eukprot:XP_023980261.1 partitioning defective 3 homolog B isoform X2 [Physeter catodon]